MKYIKEFNEADGEIIKLDYLTYSSLWKEDNEKLESMDQSLYKKPSSRFTKSVEKEINKIESLNNKKFDKKYVKPLDDNSLYIYNYDRLSSSHPDPNNRRRKIVTYGLKIWARELLDNWYLFEVYIFGKSIYFKCDSIYGISKITDYIKSIWDEGGFVYRD